MCIGNKKNKINGSKEVNLEENIWFHHPHHVHSLYVLIIHGYHIQIPSFLKIVNS